MFIFFFGRRESFGFFFLSNHLNNSHPNPYHFCITFFWAVGDWRATESYFIIHMISCMSFEFSKRKKLKDEKISFTYKYPFEMCRKCGSIAILTQNSLYFQHLPLYFRETAHMNTEHTWTWFCICVKLFNFLVHGIGYMGCHVNQHLPFLKIFGFEWIHMNFSKHSENMNL